MAADTGSDRWSDEDEWGHETTRANGVRLHYVTAGPRDGDVVLLLHGFPEFWFSWREQIPALAADGLRVIAPDLRGYNSSERPAGIGSYHLDELVTDVAGLAESLDRESVCVVGHDWGGFLAWQVAIERPALVDTLAVLNAPHPSAYERTLRTSPRQLRKSSYVLYFQLPRLPEWKLRRNDFAVLEELFLSGPNRGDAFSPADVERYKRAFAEPGALTAAINYYRALFRRNLKLAVTSGSHGDRSVEVPTLVIWGEDDHALVPSLSRGLDEWVSNLRVERYGDASHWVQFDAAERVNDALLAFL